MKPRVLIIWTEISGYIGACFRILSQRDEIVVKFVAGESGSTVSENRFGLPTFEGISLTLMSRDQFADPNLLPELIKEFNPDIIAIPGWSIPGMRRLVKHKVVIGVRLILLSDNSRSGFWRRIGLQLALGRFLRRMDAVLVPGERGRVYAKTMLGFREQEIYTGLYGVDFGSIEVAFSARLTEERRPDGFLFIGRLVAIKGIDILVNAYRLYRKRVDHPWSLVIAGVGGDEDKLSGVEGIQLRGFVQPAEIIELFSGCDVLVLPSLHDAWPLVIAEACAAGLAIICSNQCGSSVELVRDYYNGLTVPAQDVERLADALYWMHCNKSKIRAMSIRSHQLAEAYSAELWAERWINLVGKLLINRDG